MVKSYSRYLQSEVFGLISTQSNTVHLPDKNLLFTSGLDEVLIWNLKTQTIISKLNDTLTPGSLNSNSNSPPPQVIVLTYNEFSNLLAVGYSNGDIKLWDISTNSVLIKFQGHKSSISKLIFNEQGTNLISGSNDTSIIIWDLISEEGLIKLSGHKNLITDLILINDFYLISTSKDGLIKMWDLKINQCVETHISNNNETWSLGYHEKNNLILTCGLDGECKIWELNLNTNINEKKLIEIGKFNKSSKNRSVDIEFFKDFFLIGNSDKTVEIFRVRSHNEIEKAINKRKKRLGEKGLTEEEILESIDKSKVSMLICPFTIIYNDYKIKHVCFTNCNNKSLNLIINNSNNSINYWNIALPESLKKHNINEKISNEKININRQGHRLDIRTVDINEDDDLLFTGSNNQIKIWNLKTLNCIRSIEKIGNVLCGKFLPGGSLLIIGTKNGDLKLIDLSTSEIIDSIETAHSDSIWTIDLSPNGKEILTGSSDKNLKFWEIKVNNEKKLTINHIKTLELNENILSIKISPDGKYISVSLMDNTVKIFFYDSLKFYLSLYGHKLPVLSIDISFDSKMIITTSADKNIRIWGLDFGDCHKSIFGHDDSIMCVKFLPNSHNFLTCSKDKFIKYWDGDKFEQIQKFAAHQNEVWSLAVSSTGSFFVSVSHDFSIRLWKEDDEDEVFIEEEKEKIMDELYENELLESLEGDAIIKKDTEGEEGDENDNEAQMVSKKTMENLKASEKLMEALDICNDEQNSLLLAMNIKGNEYVLEVLSKIKPSQLNDSLLVLPFSYTIRLLKLIRLWTSEKNIKKNIVKLNIISRTLFFIVRSNHMELISQRDEQFKKEIVELKEQLRSILKTTCKDVGFNVEGLKFVQRQWNIQHSHVYEDKEESANGDRSRKRMYTTLA